MNFFEFRIKCDSLVSISKLHIHSHILHPLILKHMRGLILVSGMIIVVIGMAEYSLLRNYLQACESAIDVNSLDMNLLQMCDQIRYAQYGSLLVSAIGFCVSLYGTVKRSTHIVRYDRFRN